MNKRALLKNIRKKWENPEKLLDYLLEMEKQEDINRELIRKGVMKETAKNYSIALAYTLNYKYGIGKKRLPKILNDIIYTFDCFNSGHLNLEDCIEELKKVGVYIE